MQESFTLIDAPTNVHARYIELSDVLCPNETELALLCEGDIDPEDEGSVQAGAEELIARGKKRFIDNTQPKGGISLACRCGDRWPFRLPNAVHRCRS